MYQYVSALVVATNLSLCHPSEQQRIGPVTALVNRAATLQVSERSIVEVCRSMSKISALLIFIGYLWGSRSKNGFAQATYSAAAWLGPSLGKRPVTLVYRRPNHDHKRGTKWTKQAFHDTPRCKVHSYYRRSCVSQHLIMKLSLKGRLAP